MTISNEMTCTAFEGMEMIATGSLSHVAQAVKRVLDRGEQAPVLIFDDQTSEPLEMDFRGTWADVAARLPGASAPPRGPGRPKMGVVAREVTLLPRHWEWLNGQPGGASVALRRLVEEARRANAGRDHIRHAQESTYRFLTAVAGNAPGYEEVSRALFAGDGQRFDQLVEGWPEGVRTHARRLAASAFATAGKGEDHGV